MLAGTGFVDKLEAFKSNQSFNLFNPTIAELLRELTLRDLEKYWKRVNGSQKRNVRLSQMVSTILLGGCNSICRQLWIMVWLGHSTAKIFETINFKACTGFIPAIDQRKRPTPIITWNSEDQNMRSK